MNNSDLAKLLKEIQSDYPTILDVKHEKEDEVVLTDMTDFSPKKEKKVIQFKACVFNGTPLSNAILDSYMTDRVSRIEIFHVPVVLKADDPEASDYASHYSEIARHHVKVQVNPFKPDDRDVFMLIFRAVIMIREDYESMKNELLLAIKDLLAVHYIQTLNNAKLNLSKTGLDEEDQEKMVSAYNENIIQLLTDKPGHASEESEEF